MLNQDICKHIKDAFSSSGLILLGVYKEKKTSKEDISRFQKWLSKSYHAKMKYLENNLHVREDSSYVLSEVKSSICFILPYGKILSGFDVKAYSVSRYVLIKDYHKIIKEQGNKIIQKLLSFYPNENFRVITDSVPIFEKIRALSTGTGRLGLNSLYINNCYGSFVFLGEILTTLDIPSFSFDSDSKVISLINERIKSSINKCRGCKRCISLCPTEAIKAEGINATECISYLTIEHPGKVEKKYWTYFKDSFFGCDRCQICCPYNESISSSNNDSSTYKYQDLLLDSSTLSFLKNPELIISLNEKEFKKIFKGSSFLRAGYLKLVRNILIHLVVNKFNNLEELIKNVDSRVWDLVDSKELLDYYHQVTNKG